LFSNLKNIIQFFMAFLRVMLRTFLRTFLRAFLSPFGTAAPPQFVGIEIKNFVRVFFGGGGLKIVS
jgi:hypothetical protein